MILIITPRCDPEAALDYANKCGKWTESENPAIEIGGSLPDGASMENWYDEFNRVCSLRPDVKKNIIHLVLSLSEQDRKLTPIELAEIGGVTLERLGYGHCPAMYREHQDGHVQHLHLVTTAITYNGERVDRTGDRRLGQKIRQDLEIRHGLWRAPLRKGSPVRPPILQFESEEMSPEAPKLQVSSWRNRVAEIVNEVFHPGITIPQLQDALRAHGVVMRPVFTKDGANLKGFRYGYQGVEENASVIDRGLTLSSLKQVGLSYESCRDLPLLSRTTKAKSQPRVVEPVQLAMGPRSVLALTIPLVPVQPLPTLKVPHAHGTTPIDPLPTFFQRARKFAARAWCSIRETLAPARVPRSLP